MRKHTQFGWSLICSALVLLMMLGGVESASAARRHERHHSSFSRHAHPKHGFRHHHGHRHHRWQHSHYRRHHSRSRVFFGFGVHSGYPSWPYYYDPYLYGPGYANPYTPGVSQRFPDFRLPASFAYLGALARAGEGGQAAMPAEQPTPSVQPFDLPVEPQPKPGG